MAVTFRKARRGDEGLVLEYIRALAEYEHMLDEVMATESLLEEWLFEDGRAEVLFALADGEEVGFALYFYNFSTFQGRAGLYLEDLFVKPEHRGHGIGRALLKELAKTVRDKGCGRLEWMCLDWNQPSIDFYLSLGAEQLGDRTGYRLEGDRLERLADR